MISSIFTGQMKKAIQECLKQIEKSSKDKRLRLKLADLYLKNGDDEKAVKEYLQTGDLYADEDLNAKAIAVYRRVLSIDPRHIDAMRRMATLYLREGLLGDARGCYEKILRIKPGDQEALKGLSIINDSKQPKPTPADSQTEEVVSVKPLDAPTPSPPRGTETPLPDKDLELHYHLGVGYKEMGLLDYAIAEFELVSKDPAREFDCYVLLGECFREKGDSEQSKKYFALASNIGELPKDLLRDRTSTGN